MVEQKANMTDATVHEANESESPASHIMDKRGLDESEAEKFAYELVRRAVSLTGVKVEREKFFRNELAKYSTNVDIERAIASTPIAAGMTAEQVDKAARAVIDFETKKCSAISFATGIPGGIALAGTVPADLVQYFAHVLRVEQKLAYLYGWQTFLDDNDEIDDETILELVVLMGGYAWCWDCCDTAYSFRGGGCHAPCRKDGRTQSAYENRLVSPDEKDSRCHRNQGDEEYVRKNSWKSCSRNRWGCIGRNDVRII